MDQRRKWRIWKTPPFPIYLYCICVKNEKRDSEKISNAAYFLLHTCLMLHECGRDCVCEKWQFVSLSEKISASERCGWGGFGGCLTLWQVLGRSRQMIISFGKPLPPPLSNVRVGWLCPTISVTFQNQQYDIPTHFTSWPAVWRWKGARFELLSFLHNYFWHLSSLQHYECVPGETVWKCAPLSPYLNNIASPPSLWWPVLCQSLFPYCENGVSGTAPLSGQTPRLTDYFWSSMTWSEMCTSSLKAKRMICFLSFVTFYLHRKLHSLIHSLVWKLCTTIIM